jgi:type IV secretory pathway VirB2 component (pilin)
MNSPRRRRRAPDLILSLLLTVGEPLALAVTWSPLVVTIVERGPAALALAALRLGVTGLGVAAGLSLWFQRLHGVLLAGVFLAASSLVAILTYLVPLLPDRPPRGLAGPYLLATLAYNAAWLLYLRRRARTNTAATEADT